VRCRKSPTSITVEYVGVLIKLEIIDLLKVLKKHLGLGEQQCYAWERYLMKR
jgi:hypothetical protein